jgi:hypothetical protein
VFGLVGRFQNVAVISSMQITPVVGACDHADWRQTPERPPVIHSSLYLPEIPLPRRLHRRIPGADRHRALLCAGFHLHDAAVAAAQTDGGGMNFPASVA